MRVPAFSVGAVIGVVAGATVACAYSVYRPDAFDWVRGRVGVTDHRTRDGFRVLQSQIDRTSMPPAALFLGDSITAAMPVNDVVAGALNLGIPGQTSIDLAEQSARLMVLRSAAEVYVMIGTNDVAQRKVPGMSRRLRSILSLASPNAEVYLATIPASPAINAANVAAANNAIRQACLQINHCHIIDIHALTAGRAVFEADGVHLNLIGQRVWIAAMRDARQK